jgi:hypothetical protein
VPYPTHIIRPTKLTLHLPEDIRTKVDLILWSKMEQRVPKGAYQAFFVKLIEDYFKRRTELEDKLKDVVGLPVNGEQK